MKKIPIILFFVFLSKASAGLTPAKIFSSLLMKLKDQGAKNNFEKFMANGCLQNNLRFQFVDVSKEEQNEILKKGKQEFKS